MARAKEVFAKAGKCETFIDLVVPSETAAGTYRVRYGAWNPKGGPRLSLGGAPTDGRRRIKSGMIEVARTGDKISGVTWKPEGPSDDDDAKAVERGRGGSFRVRWLSRREQA